MSFIKQTDLNNAWANNHCIISSTNLWKGFKFLFVCLKKYIILISEVFYHLSSVSYIMEMLLNACVIHIYGMHIEDRNIC